MICSRCGLEYPDDMTECPGCHAPNENIEAQVLTDSERDSFTGVTIDAGDGDPDRFTIQDDEPGKTGKAGKAAGFLRAILTRHGWLLRLCIILCLAVIAAGAFFFLLPAFVFVSIAALVVYGLNRLFNR